MACCADIFAAAAWAVGCIGAESWSVLDEVAFAREGEMHASTTTGKNTYSRPRRWPNQDKTLYFSSTAGVTAFSPEFVLIAAGLRPAEETTPPE